MKKLFYVFVTVLLSVAYLLGLINLVLLLANSIGYWCLLLLSAFLVAYVVSMIFSVNQSRKTGKRGYICVALLYFAIVAILFIIFRHNICDLYRDLYSPIGPGGMVNPLNAK